MVIVDYSGTSLAWGTPPRTRVVVTEQVESHNNLTPVERNLPNEKPPVSLTPSDVTFRSQVSQSAPLP